MKVQSQTAGPVGSTGAGRLKYTITAVAKSGLDQLSRTATVVDLIATYGLLAASVASLMVSPYFFAVHSVISPLLVLRFWCIGHEASHGLVYRNRFLNDWFGLLSHGIALAPFYGWQFGHIHHHKNNAHPIKDEYLPASVLRLYLAKYKNKSGSKVSEPTALTDLNRLMNISVRILIYNLGFGRSYSAPKGLLFVDFKSNLKSALNIAFPAFFWLLYIGITAAAPAFSVFAIWIPLILGHSLIAIVGFLNHQDLEGRIKYRYKVSRDDAAHQTGSFERNQAPHGVWPTLFRLLTSKPQLTRVHGNYCLIREQLEIDAIAKLSQDIKVAA